jgi:parallel beta-helix repeat protein
MALGVWPEFRSSGLPPPDRMIFCAIETAFMTGSKQIRFLRARQHLGALVVTACLAGLTAPHGTAATLIVSNTSASGPGSFQQAILDANSADGFDTIVFQIPGTGVHTITPTNALPPILDQVVIDGTTQPGFADTPLIYLNGANAGTTSVGLRLLAGNSTIRGLVISGYGGAGIHVQAPGGTNIIEGNFIGTDPTGTLRRGNGQSSGQAGGLWIDGASGNLIGGPYATNRNLISGNSGPGLFLQNCSGNIIQGNCIGTSLSGAAALSNSNNGITLYSAGTNQIGGTSASLRNVISGNGGSGVYLIGAGTTGNLVQGNYIGTDTNGTMAIPNAGDGITAQGAGGNTIGGTEVGAGNLLSGNRQGGVGLKGTGSDNNLVQGNLIGTDASGRLALGNSLSGITISAGNSNLVGGTTTAARNIVSANKLSGIYITTNSVGNLVLGNLIGVDATGGSALGNAINGISIDSACLNTVIGAAAGARNVISGNTKYGIEIFGTAATGNLIQGNYVGTGLTGQSALGNKFSGLHIQSSGNTIGGLVSGAANLVSGNGQDGIFLDGAGASNNIVQGNLIGTAADGSSSLGNGRAGIGISGAPRNIIGGTTPNAGNLLSANGDAGVYLITTGATGNLIQGNTIGTDLTGALPMGNTYEGIYIERASTNTIGGAAPGAGNLISANKTRGIWLTNASWNVLQGNLIGTTRDGIGNLGQVYHSVECDVGACNNTIGGAGTAGNVIAFAQPINAGVRIRNGSTNNAIIGNAIFGNGALGIDLGVFGVNLNIVCGAGTGANMAQNYPVLAQAVSGNGTGVRGTLNGRPNQAFLLQFFANLACNSFGNGEGQVYLGQQTVVTSNNCNVGFVATLPNEVPVGYVITATATDSANNTSEFSACVPVTPVPTLTVSPVPNDQLALSWTNTATGFVLKETGNLSPPVQWTMVTNIPVVNNGQFVVTLPAVAGSRFYMLNFE